MRKSIRCLAEVGYFLHAQVGKPLRKTLRALSPFRAIGESIKSGIIFCRGFLSLTRGPNESVSSTGLRERGDFGAS